jgi:hypothetical protein
MVLRASVAAAIWDLSSSDEVSFSRIFLSFPSARYLASIPVRSFILCDYQKDDSRLAQLVFTFNLPQTRPVEPNLEPSVILRILPLISISSKLIVLLPPRSFSRHCRGIQCLSSAPLSLSSARQRMKGILTLRSA